MLSRLRPCLVVVSLFLVAAIAVEGAQAQVSATSIPLQQPLGLVSVADGSLFFADAGAHVIRRLAPDGTLAIVAGSGIQGFAGDGGPATLAQLDSPRAIVLSSTGDLFLADLHNHRVRRIDATDHRITTVAGSGTAAGVVGDGGRAIMAHLGSPSALVLDAANHLYIADSADQRVRQVDLATGIITTVAGSGVQGFNGDGRPASAALLDNPSGLAVDGAGNLFIADTGNHRVRRVDAVTHIISTIAGDSGSVLLARPIAVAWTSTGLMIADAARQQVLLLDPAFHLSIVAGTGMQAFLGDGGAAVSAAFDNPAGLAVSSAGLAIADSGNHRIRQVSADGTISTIAGLGTPLAGSLALSGASTQSYRSTAVMAAMSGDISSGQPVTLLDSSAAGELLLAQAPLVSGVARFSLPALSAGTHHLLATSSGDANHRAAQSQTINLTVLPLALKAILADTPPITYGEPIPTLSATLVGALAADNSRLSLSAAVLAPAIPPPGAYPVAFTLAGPAAANYTLGANSAELLVTRAPSTVNVSLQSGVLVTRIAAANLPATASLQPPTGTITLITASGAPLSTTLLDNSGSASLSTSSLPAGSYTLKPIYSGDANYLSGQASSVTFSVGSPVTPSDFALVPSASSARINAGETARFSFELQTAGSTPLAGPITLGATALPLGFTATFDPPVLPPGSAVTSFNLSVVTPRATASLRKPQRSASSTMTVLATALPLLVLALPYRRRRVLSAMIGALALCGCGARINSAADAARPPVSYPIVVTGTTTRLDGSVLQHTATVTLTVQ